MTLFTLFFPILPRQSVTVFPPFSSKLYAATSPAELGGGGALESKVAVTVMLVLVMTVQKPVPPQLPPLHPMNVELPLGGAVRVTGTVSE